MARATTRPHAERSRSTEDAHARADVDAGIDRADAVANADAMTLAVGEARGRMCDGCRAAGERRSLPALTAEKFEAAAALTAELCIAAMDENLVTVYPCENARGRRWDVSIADLRQSQPAWIPVGGRHFR